jgi:Fibronectin type III domain
VPTVKRQSITSVTVSTTVDVTPGSLIESYLISMFKVEMEIITDEVQIVVPATSPFHEMHYTIEGLLQATVYQLQIKATNRAGSSQFSDFSARVEIDALVPAIDSLEVTVDSPTSVFVQIPSFVNTKPKILGMKICWSQNGSMDPILGWSELINTNQYKKENLAIGI